MELRCPIAYGNTVFQNKYGKEIRCRNTKGKYSILEQVW